MSKDKLIPDLRFPEFKNEGEWVIEELGVLSEIVRGGSPRPIEDYFTTDENGLNWLKIADVPSDAKYITQTKEKVKKEALSSTREVNSGDLILSNSMSFGRPYILNITTCIHDGWIAIRKISNKTFEDYLYYFISSESSQTYFQTNAAGAAVKNLNAEIIKLLPIYLPKNKKEQQKIASCLSSLDEVIAAHSQKLDLLKDHKKGLMQNLFPSAGEKVPKYRFKEFENDGEWVSYLLKDLTKINQGLQIPISERFTEKVENSFFYITNEFLKSNSERRYYIKDPSKNVICNEDDVLMTRTGNTGQVVTGVSGAFHNNFFKIQFDRNILNKDFLVFFLRLPDTQRIILSYAGTSTIPDLNHSDFYRILMKIPSSKEQQKIASCLSSLDALITAQTERIEQLKLHKKGLMQGLFPKLDD
ncbi:restriction endonuclease subunit S [Flavobacterium sp.]|uniref:restriction endonuclease subunit S n=1 Tax=Flavobacterium sp. TaxID=239 RepID=UPI0026338E54|nr:restriction endonuclease subunit S [Flavobacterium sp.]